MHGVQCTPTRSGQVLGFFLKLRETQCRQSLPLPHLDAKQVPWLRTRTCLLVEGGKLGRLPPRGATPTFIFATLTFANLPNIAPALQVHALATFSCDNTSTIA